MSGPALVIPCRININCRDLQRTRAQRGLPPLMRSSRMHGERCDVFIYTCDTRVRSRAVMFNPRALSFVASYFRKSVYRRWRWDFGRQDYCVNKKSILLCVFGACLIMVVVTPLCVSHLAIRTGQMRNGLTQDDGRINAARYKRLFKCDIAGRDKPARRSWQSAGVMRKTLGLRRSPPPNRTRTDRNQFPMNLKSLWRRYAAYNIRHDRTQTHNTHTHTHADSQTFRNCVHRKPLVGTAPWHNISVAYRGWLRLHTPRTNLQRGSRTRPPKAASDMRHRLPGPDPEPPHHKHTHTHIPAQTP